MNKIKIVDKELKYYYHLTTKNYLQNILKNGLQCKIGENSQKVNETTSQIYLCRLEDLPYWEILLDKNIIIQVNKDGISDFEEFDYDGYQEITCKKDISQEYIKHVDIKIDKAAAMHDLCISYLYHISRITEIAARAYTNNYLENCGKQQRNDTIDYLSQILDSFFAASDKLDYASVAKEEIRTEIKNAGENCAYTFCDEYLETGRRLWEQLLYYPENKFTSQFKQLHNYIKTNFEGCTDVNTGGWTE